MNEVKFCVEGSPKAVAEFLNIFCSSAKPTAKELITAEASEGLLMPAPAKEEPVKRGRKKAKKEEASEVVAAPAEDPQPVVESEPVVTDPEFEGVVVEGSEDLANRAEKPAPKSEKPKVTLEAVRNAIVEYGVYLSQKGVSPERLYMEAFIRKYGKAEKLADIDPALYESFIEACASRPDISELEEYK